MKSFNIFNCEVSVSSSDRRPLAYRAPAIRLGPKLGASLLGMTVWEIPVGTANAPYHFERSDEEWLLVLSGSPTVRTPTGEKVLEPGDVVCFPAGPDGAHEVRNASEERVRVALFSSRSEVGISEYPDAGMIAGWEGDEMLFMVPRAQSVDYWEGVVPSSERK